MLCDYVRANIVKKSTGGGRNDSAESFHAFVKVTMPEVDGTSVYTYEPGPSWEEVTYGVRYWTEILEPCETIQGFRMQGYACQVVGEMDGAEAWKITVGE